MVKVVCFWLDTTILRLFFLLFIYLFVYLFIVVGIIVIIICLTCQTDTQTDIDMTRFDQPTKPWTMMVLPGGLQEVWLCTPSGEPQRGGQKNWGKKSGNVIAMFKCLTNDKKGNSTVKTGWFHQQWGLTKVSWNELPDFTNKRWFL